MVAWNGFWSRRYGGLPEPDEVHRVKTPEGHTFALSRFRAAEPEKKHPVILCHGLSGNHFLMDPYPAPSLARTLAGHGYDTWAIDLRHAGFSVEKHRGTARLAHWDFDSYLEQEMKTALESVHRQTGAPQVHWIGHSMGGMLLLCHLAQGNSSAIRSGVTIASALDFNGTATDFKQMLKIRVLISKMNSLPIQAASHTLIPFTGHFSNAIERFAYWQDNVHPEMARRIHACYYEKIPTALMLQLATIMEPGGFRNRDGSVRYADRLGEVKTPVLALAADRDRQCSANAAANTFEKLGSDRKEFILFGKEQGHGSHYGHMDLLIGKRADREVFPKILAWLDQTD
ncbi:MAG: hypothetical protein A2X94_00360 [Bdellovibrionales bacterium GWB1_55_8]|nr:MAG: hypothetical protein A2X94_00360 [Bdellovibrionales bacterium GWB1_55_8]